MEDGVPLKEFTDIEKTEHDDIDDAENGECDKHRGSYHFSTSLIKKRGFNSIHQVCQKNIKYNKKVSLSKTKKFLSISINKIQ